MVTRYGHAVPAGRIEVLQAAHPVPDEASVQASTRILQAVQGLEAKGRQGTGLPVGQLGCRKAGVVVTPQGLEERVLGVAGLAKALHGPLQQPCGGLQAQIALGSLGHAGRGLLLPGGGPGGGIAAVQGIERGLELAVPGAQAADLLHDLSGFRTDQIKEHIQARRSGSRP